MPLQSQSHNIQYGIQSSKGGVTLIVQKLFDENDTFRFCAIPVFIREVCVI
uniref:Uncharacterized protein n=1 Tax=Rhizophora mucronata TaxID=61149 RepID=A0A2P2QPE0_RHIMU